MVVAPMMSEDELPTSFRSLAHSTLSCLDEITMVRLPPFSLIPSASIVAASLSSAPRVTTATSGGGRPRRRS